MRNTRRTLAVLMALTALVLAAVSVTGCGLFSPVVHPKNEKKAGASAESTPTQEVTMPQREELEGALATPLEKDLRQKVSFEGVTTVRVVGDWAFVAGAPRAADGKPIDYTTTTYAAAVKSGFFDDNFSALLHKVGGEWKVVAFDLGSTDVPWVEWSKIYGAPEAVLPPLK